MFGLCTTCILSDLERYLCLQSDQIQIQTLSSPGSDGIQNKIVKNLANIATLVIPSLICIIFDLQVHKNVILNPLLYQY